MPLDIGRRALSSRVLTSQTSKLHLISHPQQTSSSTTLMLLRRPHSLTLKPQIIYLPGSWTINRPYLRRMRSSLRKRKSSRYSLMSILLYSASSSRRTRAMVLPRPIRRAHSLRRREISSKSLHSLHALHRRSHPLQHKRSPMYLHRQLCHSTVNPHLSPEWPQSSLGRLMD